MNNQLERKSLRFADTCVTDTTRERTLSERDREDSGLAVRRFGLAPLGGVTRTSQVGPPVVPGAQSAARIARRRTVSRSVALFRTSLLRDLLTSALCGCWNTNI